MKFFPHALVYLDILGFCNFVEEAETDQDKLKSLDKLFNEVIPREISMEGKNLAFPKDLGLQYLSCSDSIVISAPVTETAPYPPIVAVSIKSIQIAHALLDMGFLVRGAISQGNVYRTDSNILGTGFQEAVKAEKNTGNPKIILTDSAEKAINDLIEKGYTRYSIFAKDEIDQVILNSLHPEKRYLPDPEGEITEYFGRYRETILNNLSNDNHSVKEKWHWFAILFEANVNYFSDLKRTVPSLSINGKLPIVTLNYLNPPETDQNWFESFKTPGFSLRFRKTGEEPPSHQRGEVSSTPLDLLKDPENI